MDNRRINEMLLEVQSSAACHQKFLLVFEKLYDQTQFEEFFGMFMHKIRVMFQQEIIDSNPYSERFLDFCAQFVALITKRTQNDSISEFKSPHHPLLNRVIEETLKFHRLRQVHARYHSCTFITLILKHIGSQIQLNNDICDQIQEAMLERIDDPKASIRVQAILAMVRLQEPLVPDCPVIKAYVASFYDINTQVRREAVNRVAPNTMTITKIIERVRDVEPSVRLSALQRCADIGPRLIKIVDRQSILTSGFSDSNSVVRKVFIETLLPKWLTHYERDYLNFIQGLKLDADEEDIKMTYNLALKIMNVFFGRDPITEIISALPVSKEDKLVPVDELTSETTMYWCILSNYLRDSEDEGEQYLEKILPDFTPFCNYIDSFIKLKTSKPLDEWENMDYQCILNYLLEMAERYDFSDEVGRRTFNELIWNVLQNYRFQPKITTKLITIAEKLSTNQDGFITEICNLISEVEKPLVENPPSPQKLKEKEFLLAQLRVKINILEGDREDAIDKGEYTRLEKIMKELNEVKVQVTALTEENTQSVKVRVVKTDSETICYCLDLLIGVLSLVSLKKMFPSLRMIYNEFVSPLLTSSVVEVNWRVLNCLALYSVIDKDIAQDNAKIFCIPIATYRAIPNYNKHALITSVSAISDLIRIYGVGIFGEEENSTNGSTIDRNTTRRRLYRNEDMDDVCVVDQNRMSVDYIVEIILDMLDDECDEIRNVAIDSIGKLILDGFSASPLILSRMILKWYNPLFEKQDAIQQKLGVIIEQYTKTVKGAREVVEKAVLPILTSISKAPKSSPLADIDVDNMLRFLAVLTNTSGTTDIVHVHSNLAHTLCNKIASKPNDDCTVYLTKMLLFLEIPPDGASVKELIRQAELLSEHLRLKWPKKNILKFINKLRGQTVPELTTIEESVADEVGENKENSSKRKEVVDASPENSAKRRVVEKEVEALAPLQIVSSSSASSSVSGRSTRKKMRKKVAKEKENTTPSKEENNTIEKRNKNSQNEQSIKKNSQEIKNKQVNDKTNNNSEEKTGRRITRSQEEINKQTKNNKSGNKNTTNHHQTRNAKNSSQEEKLNLKSSRQTQEETKKIITPNKKNTQQEKSSRRNITRSQEEINKIVSTPNKRKSKSQEEINKQTINDKTGNKDTTNNHQTRNAKNSSQEEKLNLKSSRSPNKKQTQEEKSSRRNITRSQEELSKQTINNKTGNKETTNNHQTRNAKNSSQEEKPNLKSSRSPNKKQAQEEKSSRRNITRSQEEINKIVSTPNKRKSRSQEERTQNKKQSQEEIKPARKNTEPEKPSRRNITRSQEEINKLVSTPNKRKSRSQEEIDKQTKNPQQTSNKKQTQEETKKITTPNKKNTQQEKSTPNKAKNNNKVQTNVLNGRTKAEKRSLSAKRAQNPLHSDVNSPLRKKNRSQHIQQEKGTKRKEAKSTSSSDSSPSRKSPRKPKRKKMDDFVL